MLANGVERPPAPYGVAKLLQALAPRKWLNLARMAEMSHSSRCNFSPAAAFKYVETVGQWLSLQKQPPKTTGGILCST